jgi:hypothetical protein
MDRPSWLRLDLAVSVQPPLEVRAEPSAGGGWTVRGERTTGREGTVVLGILQQTPQAYAIVVGQ